MAKIDKGIVCINFDKGKLKIAYAKSLLHKVEITKLIIKDIKGLADDEIAGVIKEIFKDIGFKGSKVVYSVPSYFLINKNIEIPSRDSEEIKEILNLQAGRYTPYSREEIIIDYTVVGTYKENYTKILLVIIPRKLVERCLKILAESGLGIDRIVIAPEGIGHLYQQLSRNKIEDKPVVIVNISDEHSDFTVLRKNKILFIRSIPFGIEYFLAKKKEFEVKFIEEVKESIKFYQSEEIDEEPHRFILTGAVKDYQDLKTILENNLTLPLDVIPYYDVLPFTEEVRREYELERKVSFLDVISPSLVLEKLLINVLPEETKLKKGFEERGKEIIKTGALVMGILILVCSILIGKVYMKEFYLQKIKDKYKSVNSEAEDLIKDFSKIKIIKDYLSKRGHSLEMLNVLYETIPDNIYLNHIRVSEDNQFSIEGTSQSMSTVFNFVKDIEKSKYFKDTKTEYTTKRKEDGKDLTDFKITTTLENEK